MTDDMISRGIRLSASFNAFVIRHPEILESIPDGAQVIVLPAHDPELRQYNERLAKDLERRGEEVVYFEEVPQFDLVGAHL